MPQTPLPAVFKQSRTAVVWHSLFWVASALAFAATIFLQLRAVSGSENWFSSFLWLSAITALMSSALVYWYVHIHRVLEFDRQGLTYKIGSLSFRISRSDLRGIYMDLGDNARRLALVRNRWILIKIPDEAWRDRANFDWLTGLPDLHRESARLISRGLAAAPQFGQDRAARQMFFRSANQTTKIYNYACVPLLIAHLLWPSEEYFTEALLVVYVLAGFLLLIWGRGSVRIDTILHARNPRPTIGFAILVAMVVLPMADLDHAYHVNSDEPVFGGLIFGCFLAGVQTWQDRWTRERKLNLFLLWTLSCVISIVMFFSANVSLDRSVANVSHSYLKEKEANRSRGTSYKFLLINWLPGENEKWFKVNYSRFEHTRVGAAVCVSNRTGFFGWPWSTVVNCPPK